MAGPGLQSSLTVPLTRRQRVSTGTLYKRAVSLNPFPEATHSTASDMAWHDQSFLF